MSLSIAIKDVLDMFPSTIPNNAADMFPNITPSNAADMLLSLITPALVSIPPNMYAKNVADMNPLTTTNMFSVVLSAHPKTNHNASHSVHLVADN